MGSALLSNDRVGFVVTKPFTSGEKEYAVGDDFDQNDARNIEVLVRARFVCPVVEDLADRPKYWYKDVKLKSALLEKLAGDRVQLVMPEGQEPDSDEVVDLEVLTHPETTPEPEGEGESVLPEEHIITSIDEEPEDSGEEEATEPATEDGEEVAPDAEPESDLFDPGEHTVVEVNDYLAEHPEDADRVLEAERNGKARKGILES